ncbi:MAG: hypothetical protein OQK04_06430 [Kangiellaceae bacterium]|nr:hypothetical protein [Kangiellaceae bacterium]MCW8998335.1 hypothetical protein [Kangiellaceae bacterium]
MKHSKKRKVITIILIAVSILIIFNRGFIFTPTNQLIADIVTDSASESRIRLLILRGAEPFSKTEAGTAFEAAVAYKRYAVLSTFLDLAGKQECKMILNSLEDYTLPSNLLDKVNQLCGSQV